MRIAVFGLGYVGTVSAACFADLGHRVVGVDVDADKVEMIRSGRSPVIEEHLPELVATTVARAALTATTDAAEAVRATDIALVCVGTPSRPDGSLSTEYLEKVIADIGRALRERTERYRIVVRSTMLPGTSERVLLPGLEAASGLSAGTDFGYSTNPEFLREGSSVLDFRAPPKTVVGHLAGGEEDARTVADLYGDVDAPRFLVPLRVAEMTKYADNAFHALKVAFGNEMGSFCQAMGVDSHDLMEIFLSDTKLNISPAYLRPGMPFGGSCLPKDLRSLLYEARHSDVRLPLLDSVLQSNEVHGDRIWDLVARTGARRVGVFGLAFKAGTDDLRESPMVSLCERLLGRGFELLIHDPVVSLSSLRGANRAYVDRHIPHLSRLMVGSLDAVAQHGEVLVLARADDEVVAAVERAPATAVIDLVRNHSSRRLSDRSGYEGVAW